MKITYTELKRLEANGRKRKKLERLVAALLTANAALKQQILDLVADDATKLAKAKTIYEQSEANEAAMKKIVK